MDQAILGTPAGDLIAVPEEGPGPGQRLADDRRGAATSPWDALRLWGRRSQVRREAERRGAYFVDRHNPVTLAFVVSVLVLTLVDGVLTIILLELNSEEANPVMRMLLERGHWQFLIGKYVLTASGLAFLVVFKNWPLFGTRFRVGFCLPIFAAMYIALLVYQMHLLHL